MTQATLSDQNKSFCEFRPEWCDFTGTAVAIDSPWDLPHRPEDVAPLLYIRVDGREIRFRLIRQDPQRNRRILIMLHGMGVTAASFGELAPYLYSSHDLLLVDYNSFASQVGWPPGGISLPQLAGAVWHVVDSLAIGQVSILGSSLGGGLAMLMAGERPGAVEKLILINGAVYPQKLPRMYRLIRIPILGELIMLTTPAKRLVDGVAWLGYTDPEKMPARIRLSYERNMSSRKNRFKLMDVMRALPGHPWELQSQVAGFRKLPQKTLVVWGAQEKLLPVDTATRLCADMPSARLAEFADLAHLPHEEAPERVGPVLAEFLKEE